MFVGVFLPEVAQNKHCEHKHNLLWLQNQTVSLYLRTAPQYLQSTRKIGLRARVTRMCDVCLIRTTMASTNWSISTHVCTRSTKKKSSAFLTFQKGPHRVCITFTMVLLCRMKVWKPNHRSFMHSSNATITKASSSRVAWTYRHQTLSYSRSPCSRARTCVYPLT